MRSRQFIDADGLLAAIQRDDDQRKADSHLGRGDGNDKEHTRIWPSMILLNLEKRNQGQIGSVEIHFQRHVDDQRVAVG